MLGWWQTQDLAECAWTCGYCGCKVGGNQGYQNESEDKVIYICPRCSNPTAFIEDEGTLLQIPQPAIGNEISKLPSDISDLYNEIRRCVQYTAYTSAILSMRKLLMHIAVEQGANEGLTFIQYVEFLSDRGWIPPNGKQWVDKIRRAGNEANHEIKIESEREAKQLLDFVSMLLRFVYEFPLSCD